MALRELLSVMLLISSAMSADEWSYDGCMEGYKPVGNVCIFITPPVTWLEAVSTCPRSSTEQELVPSGEIKYFLVQSGVKEVWRGDIESVYIPERGSKLYSYFASRWQWRNSSDSACVTFVLETGEFQERSCSPEDVKYQYYCLRDRYKELSFIKSGTCPTGFVTSLSDKYCYLGVKSINNKNNFSWTDVEDYCKAKGSRIQMLQTGYRSLIGSGVEEALCGDQEALVPLRIKQTSSNNYLWLLGDGSSFKPVSEDDLSHLSSTSHLGAPLHDKKISFSARSGAWTVGTSHYSCAVCEAERGVAREPALSLALTHGADLVLTIYNFDWTDNSTLPGLITCYNDASVSSFSADYNEQQHIEIARSENNHDIIVRRTTFGIKDTFFLRIKKYKNMKMEATGEPSGIDTLAISEVAKGRFRNIEISLTVKTSGTYWCEGTNRVKDVPMWTNKVSVAIRADVSYLRYAVLVQLKSNAMDNSEHGETFSQMLATVLNIQEGVLELKRIFTRDKVDYLLFHATLPPEHQPLAAVDGVLVDNVPTEIKMVVVSVGNTAECRPMNITDSSGEVHLLPATALGNQVRVASARNNCTIGVGVCVGDEVEAAYWMPLNLRRSLQVSGDCNDEYIDAATDLHTLTITPLNSSSLPEVTNLVHALLAAGEGISNSEVLRDIDKILTTLVLDEESDGIVKNVSPEVAILVAEVEPSNPCVGITLDQASNNDALQIVRSSESDGSYDYSSSTEVAVFYPRSLAKRFSRASFSVFSSTRSFPSNMTAIVNSKVVNIVLSNDGMATRNTFFAEGEFVEILFKPTRDTLTDSETKVCVFWNVESSEWSSEGCYLHAQTDQGLDVCRCNHLTHFAEIITGGSDIAPGHRLALEVLSIVGSALSLLGLLAIAVTAVVFKSWRQELGNQILLSLSAALALNLVMYLLVYGGVGGTSGLGCIAVGALLHYSVLACFCWMLIMSVLQINRLLTLAGNQGTFYLLLKASLFGWLIPVVPIFILLVWDPIFYTSIKTSGFERDFCYPVGAAYYVTLVTPVAVIVLLNIVLYVLIACRLCSCFGWGEFDVDLKRHGNEGVMAMRRLRTLIFLFFLFGLTWTFGFLGQIMFFAYVFCITATMQGFAIFVFFFVVERKPRRCWRKLITGSTGKHIDSEAYSKSSGAAKSTGSTRTTGTRFTFYSENVPLQLDEESNRRPSNEPEVKDDDLQEQRPLMSADDEDCTEIDDSQQSPIEDQVQNGVSAEVKDLENDESDSLDNEPESSDPEDQVHVGNIRSLSPTVSDEDLKDVPRVSLGRDEFEPPDSQDEHTQDVPPVNLGRDECEPPDSQDEHTQDAVSDMPDQTKNHENVDVLNEEDNKLDPYPDRNNYEEAVIPPASPSNFLETHFPLEIPINQSSNSHDMLALLKPIYNEDNDHSADVVEIPLLSEMNQNQDNERHRSQPIDQPDDLKRGLLETIYTEDNNESPADELSKFVYSPTIREEGRSRSPLYYVMKDSLIQEAARETDISTPSTSETVDMSAAFLETSKPTAPISPYYPEKDVFSSDQIAPEKYPRSPSGESQRSRKNTTDDDVDLLPPVRPNKDRSQFIAKCPITRNY